MAFVELEVVIQPMLQGGYQAQARVRQEQGDSITPVRPIQLDPDDPVFANADADLCGRALTAAVFTPEMANAYATASGLAQGQTVPLRVRLRIEPGASALQALRWETLAEPGTLARMASDGRNTIFSRYLFSREFRLPLLRPKRQISALVAIANPSNMNASLTRIDVAAQAAIAQGALAPHPTQILASPGAATVNNILHGLGAGADIFVLMCHGSLANGKANLLLEDAAGKNCIVDGGMLAKSICALDKPPSLVVLLSCQSAGAPGMDAMTALGPMLAEQGVPAVLAMQGNLSVDSASLFMPAFFAELLKHGEVDKAVSAARMKLLLRHDWWMPAVFTRLNNARIWYPPGFRGITEGDDPWSTIEQNLSLFKCTPIIGPAVGEAVFGSRKELASHWGEIHRYPMAGNDIEDLPQVAQYLSVVRQGVFPRRDFYQYVYNRLAERYASVIPGFPAGLSPAQAIKDLDSVISLVGAHLRASNPAEPHAVLASYKQPLYLTTDPSNLLADALRAKGVQPQVRVLRWNEAARRCDERYLSPQANNPVEPTVREGLADAGNPDTPIVMKLFGDLSDPESLVLTEDDYFQYLAKAATPASLMPPSVPGWLVSSALLFVGFQAEAWEFRVLVRSLLSTQGHSLRNEYEHFAAQIDPNSIFDPASARKYIEQYLQSKTTKLKLFWGDVPTFMSDLQSHVRPPP